MGMFEAYLEEFSQSISLLNFVVNLIITAILCVILRLFYIRFGRSISNRNRFANNFLPLGLTTLLIISIVKSSLALSLGLVGALSIVRFRAAIKDPEELTYLFLCIAIGLAAGANQILLALLAFAFIIGLLWLDYRFGGNLNTKRNDGMYLNIQTDVDDMSKIANLLSETLPHIELKRMDKRDNQLSLSFVIKANSINDLELVKQKIIALSPQTYISMVEQPELVV